LQGLTLLLLIGPTLQWSVQSRTDTSCVCGVENKPKDSERAEDRIIGGSFTAPNQYPWMVRLEVKDCGGSLISDRHILTAYHCVNKGPGDYVKVAVHNQLDPEDYDLAAVEDVETPSTKTTGEHDIAIIILAKPLTFSHKIRPVCLPSSKDNVYVGEKVTHMGWGMTGYNTKQSPKLKHVDLKVAQTTSKKLENFLETEAKVVDGVPQDACQGDSGGPLIHQDETTGRWTIIGTVNGRGYSCKDDEGHDDNGRWAKVTAHLSWIKEILAIDAVTSTCVNEQECKCATVEDMGGASCSTLDCTEPKIRRSLCPKTCQCASVSLPASCPTPAPATTTPKPCEYTDYFKENNNPCKRWAKNGSCESKNKYTKSYMKNYCEKTCFCN